MNRWDDRYKHDRYFYGTKPNAFLARQYTVFEHLPHVACYAEGEGRNAVFLATKGHQVTAYDYAQEGLRKTAELAAQFDTVVETKHHDLLNDALEPEQYDGAVMIFGHFAKDQQLHVLEQIMTSLKPGGIFLMEVYEEAQLAYKTGGPPNIDYLYAEETLRDWAQQYEVLHFDCVEVTRHEGVGHKGLCKVVQVIVKK